MPAHLTPGDDPRLAPLLGRLTGLGVPVLPLDYRRIGLVFPPGRRLEWTAARELLVALLAKDEAQRATVRGEFRRYLPPVEDAPPGPAGAASDAEPTDAAGALAPDPERADGGAAPSRGAAQSQGPVLPPRQRRWPLWRLALGASLAAVLILTALLVLPIRQPVEPATTPPPAPPPEMTPPPPGELPAAPIRYFNDWVPRFETPSPAALLAAWLPPLALLCAGLLGLAWLWERARRLREPDYSPVPFDPDGQPVFAWSPADLRLPALLDAAQRRDMVWGVQRFASERATPLLDVPATVRASAELGIPEPRFAPARYEREVWLWLDTRLRTRASVALAQEIERALVRAGLCVRRATFQSVPDRLRFANRECASALDLGPAARQALVCLFTDGLGLAQVLEGPEDDESAGQQRVLRELCTWPRLCLVDFASPGLDLALLARRIGVDCCAPAALPAWLAERQVRAADRDGMAPAGLAVRLWAAACALPRLPVTAPQARALYEALGLPLASRLPAPDRGHAGADGIRFTDRERRGLLADLARWVWEDGPESEPGRCLATALEFWESRIGDGAKVLEEIARDIPGAPPWPAGPGDCAQTIERLLLQLWRGDRDAARAVRDLYNLYQQAALGPVVRERLAELGAQGLARRDADAGRIVLPWSWQALPETPGEPRGTARQRLLCMGFAGAEPNGHQRLGAETRLLLGALAGIALAGLIGLGQRIAALEGATVAHDAPVYDSALFQSLVTERRQGGRLHAASRKLVDSAEAVPGADLRLHWCWSGLEPGRAAPACRGIDTDPANRGLVNVLPLGQSALLRAGSLAEPIRACAEGWPGLAVAVIAGDPWDWPTDKDNNLSARQLAIRLLDSGAVDLALIGPDWAQQARRLAAQWAFVEDSQWLFFVPLGGAGAVAGPDPAEIPALGRHRALIQADYARLAAHLRDRVQGVLDPNDQRERPAPEVARIRALAGNPRLWGGPERADGPGGIRFVRVCPGTFTMGSAAAAADTPEDLKPYDWERPAHPVILDGFEIARTETTGAQYAALAKPTGPTDAQLPVAEIDWTDARAACRRLGPDADLPSEAQWEYAARGGGQEPYPFPDDLAGLCRYANGAGAEYPYGDWKNKSCSDPFKQAAPVGSFPPNPLGLYDMHGNLWEWVGDCWDETVYSRRGPDPTASPMEDQSGCGGRVLRGGSFGGLPRHLRSAVRRGFAPELRNQLIGFRCVRGSGRQSNH